jgi:hypothetical protein
MNEKVTIRFLLLLTGLILPSVVQATPDSDALKATMTVQWCPTQQQIHFVLLFGYGLEEAQGPAPSEAEVWPLGYHGAFGLGAFGTGGTPCTMKTCPDHPAFDSATRPPAWRLQHSLESSSLPKEVTISIPDLETDPSFGPDSLWHFQLQPSDVKDEQGCRSINALLVPSTPIGGHKLPELPH